MRFLASRIHMCSKAASLKSIWCLLIAVETVAVSMQRASLESSKIHHLMGTELSFSAAQRPSS